MSSRAHPVDGDLSPATVGGGLPMKSSPHRHKVGIPPKQNMFKDFMYTFKETFFHDDPLRDFKDQPKSKKFMLGLQSVFPVFDWGRNYNFKKFRGDLISGLTIASLCIPQVENLNSSTLLLVSQVICTCFVSYVYSMMIAGYWIR